jgi:hypothetical protein
VKGLKESELKAKIEASPSQFLEFVNDKYNETKYLIMRMVSHEVLKVIGTTVIATEDNSTIAYSMEEAVHYFRNKENAKTVSVLKARLDNAVK